MRAVRGPRIAVGCWNALPVLKLIVSAAYWLVTLNRSKKARTFATFSPKVFSPNFVLKASVHHTEGNHFASPVEDASLVAAYHDAEARYQSTGVVTQVPPRKTTALLLGAQFSF